MPRNTRSGMPSIVIVAASPRRTAPMSPWRGATSTSMCLGSAAIVNSADRVRRNRLALADIARQHGAVRRRHDVGIAEIKLGAVDQCLIELHGAFVTADDQRLIRHLPPHQGICRQLPAQTCQIGAILFQDRLIAQKLAAILVEHRLIRPRIDLGADLSRFDFAIVVASEILHGAGNARADDNGLRRIDGARRRHRARNRAARRGNRDIARQARRGKAPQRGADAGCDKGNHAERSTSVS